MLLFLRLYLSLELPGQTGLCHHRANLFFLLWIQIHFFVSSNLNNNFVFQSQKVTFSKDHSKWWTSKRAWFCIVGCKWLPKLAFVKCYPNWVSIEWVRRFIEVTMLYIAQSWLVWCLGDDAIHNMYTHYTNMLRLHHTNHSLRSSTSRLKYYIDKAFAVAAPTLWNSLTTSLRISSCLSAFKITLKMHLFKAAYDL